MQYYQYSREWGPTSQHYLGPPTWSEDHEWKCHLPRRVALGPYHEQGTCDVATSSVILWACSECCKVVENGDYLGNHPGDEFDSKQNGLVARPRRSASAELCLDCPEFVIPHTSWKQVWSRAPSRLPMAREGEGMCLVEGLSSILRHLLQTNPEIYQACPSAEEKAERWLAILRRFMKQQLLDARQTGTANCLKSLGISPA